MRQYIPNSLKEPLRPPVQVLSLVCTHQLFSLSFSLATLADAILTHIIPRQTRPIHTQSNIQTETLRLSYTHTDTHILNEDTHALTTHTDSDLPIKTHTHTNTHSPRTHTDTYTHTTQTPRHSHTPTYTEDTHRHTHIVHTHTHTERTHVVSIPTRSFIFPSDFYLFRKCGHERWLVVITFACFIIVVLADGNIKFLSPKSLVLCHHVISTWSSAEVRYTWQIKVTWFVFWLSLAYTKRTVSLWLTIFAVDVAVFK